MGGIVLPMENTLNNLTSKQKEILRFIYQTVKTTQLPPSIREIASHFDLASTATVRDHLKALVDKGCIRITANKSRAIELVKEKLFSIPIMGRVAAGLPSLAVEDIEGYLNLDSIVFSDDNIFALRVKGDSMIQAGIMPGDLVLVRKQTMAKTGETVVALIGDEATVKYLKRKDNDFYLEPANPRYEPRLMDDNVSIIGKVISVVRRYQ